MARKWQKLAAIRPRKITFPRCGTSSMPEKGHFVVYTADQNRFVLLLSYLNNKVVTELLNLAEEELGLPTNGHLTFPCDGAFMEFVVTFIRQPVDEDIEKALLMSIATCWCLSSSYLQQEQTSQSVATNLWASDVRQRYLDLLNV